MGIDLSQYMGAYIDGSRENLDTMDRMLLAIEQNPGNLDAVEEIFRAAHTLKGMSATMGFEKVAHLTHEMENVLDKLRSRQIPVTAQIIDIIFETFDILRVLVNDSISQTNSNVDLGAISGKLSAVASGQAPAAAPPPPSAPPPAQAAPAAAAHSASPGGGGDMSRYSSEIAEFQISEFEASGFADAQQAGQNPILMIVRLVPDCLLKGPRIFMVLRSLDAMQCEIKKAIPEVKDLENEKFEHSFKMLLATSRAPQEIKDTIESISEIESADVVALRVDDLFPGAVGAAPAAPEAPPPPQPAPVFQSQPATAYTPPPAPAAAPRAPVAAPPPPPAASRPTASPGELQPIQSLPVQTATSESDDRGEDSEEKARETVELVHLVSFAMAGETYALEIIQVEGIINLIPITRLPKAPAHFEGIINMRGEIVPVINLRHKLKLTQKERAPGDQIIILTFEKEKVKVGLLVDSVKEVLRLPKTSIDPASKVSEGMNVEFLNGVGKIGNKIIILLNAQRIIFG